MMKIFAVTMYFFMSISFISGSHSYANDVGKNADVISQPATLEAFVDAWMKDKIGPGKAAGATVSIVRGGKVLLSKGYGYADLDKKKVVNPDKTLFRIGSISKLFTYTAMMQLVEKGQLDLSTNINKYLNDMQVPDAFGVPLTATHLMTHRGGFENTVLGIDFLFDVEKVPTPQGYLTGYPEARVAAPGVRTSYSNYGISLLGHIIEEITGQSFIDYVEQHITEPLGMRTSSFREPFDTGRFKPMPKHLWQDIAKPYTYSGGTLSELPLESISPAAAPAGSMFSTASDMAKFMMMYLSGGQVVNAGGQSQNILMPETVQKMRARHYVDRIGATDLAHGFFSSTVNGYETIGHGGGMLGFLSDLELVPEEGLGVFISLNSADIRPGSFTKDVIGYMLPKKKLQGKPDYILAEKSAFEGLYLANRRPYTGLSKLLYLQSGMRRVTVSTDGYLQYGNKTWGQYKPNFFAALDNPEEVIVFDVDENGTVTRFHDTRAISYDRIAFMHSAKFSYVGVGLSILLSVIMLSWALCRRKDLRGTGTIFAVTSIAVLSVSGLLGLGMYQAMTAGPAIILSWPPMATKLGSIASIFLPVLLAVSVLSLWRAWVSVSKAFKIWAILYIAILGWCIAALHIWNVLRF